MGLYQFDPDMYNVSPSFVSVFSSNVVLYSTIGLILSYVSCALPYLEPKFLPSASNVTYTKGDLAILFCAVQNLGSKIVSWRKTSDPSPLTVGTLVYVADKRFHISYIEYRGEWNLYIKNVSHEDAGLYECQVGTQMRDMRKFVLLNVKDPSIPTTTEVNKAQSDILISGPVSVDVGNELYVSCNVSTIGYNKDLFHIEWFVEGNIVDEKQERLNITNQTSDFHVQSTLTIKHASKDDSGEYLCRTSGNQIARQHIFVLNGEKSSSNTKRRTEKTEKQNVSSTAISEHIPSLSTHYLFYCLTITYTFCCNIIS